MILYGMITLLILASLIHLANKLLPIDYSPKIIYADTKEGDLHVIWKGGHECKYFGYRRLPDMELASYEEMEEIDRVKEYIKHYKKPYEA